MDNIRVRLGTYDKNFISATTGALGANENRVTVFLWPYLGESPAVYINKTGAKVPPFNLGSLYP